MFCVQLKEWVTKRTQNTGCLLLYNMCIYMIPDVRIESGHYNDSGSMKVLCETKQKDSEKRERKKKNENQ